MAEQSVRSPVTCLLSPRLVPGPSCPREPEDVVLLWISFPTLDSKALSGKIKSPSTLLNFFRRLSKSCNMEVKCQYEKC